MTLPHSGGPAAPSSSSVAKPASPVERAKESGVRLRGAIDGTLDDPEAVSFSKDDVQLLKFHGIYQQDDRDQRTTRRAAGASKAYRFMVRVGPPGGRLTAEQYLALHQLARDRSDGSLRLTSRQGIQFHGIEKSALRSTVQEISEALLTTFGACGDVPRNIMAPPTPLVRQPSRLVRDLAMSMSRELKPRTAAYHEIWLRETDDQPWERNNWGTEPAGADSASAVEEPFYGSAYLPRKFKIALALSDDNSVDVFSNDLGFIGLIEPEPGGEDIVERFVVLAGGGLGMTHNRPETMARIATPLGVVPADLVIETARAIVALHRDLGDRSNRRRARLKYLVEELGLERFRTLLEQRLAAHLDPLPANWNRLAPGLLQQQHLGLHSQGDGRWFLGLAIDAGRIRGPLGDLLAELVRKFRPTLIVTPMQGLILADLERPAAEQCLHLLEGSATAHVATRNRSVRALAMACPALPTCGLALAESERVSAQVLDSLQALLDELGLTDRPLVVRMTGCPNGCARPYNADIGLVGRKPGRYHLYLGGNPRGDALGELYEEEVPLDEVPQRLEPVLRGWRDGAEDDEALGDWFRRQHGLASRTVLTGRETALRPLEIVS